MPDTIAAPLAWAMSSFAHTVDSALSEAQRLLTKDGTL